MPDEKTETKFVTKDFLWAYIALGVFFVAMALQSIWGEGGLMVDLFAFPRILTVIIAILFGFGLGWLVYPRRYWPFTDD